MRVSGNPLGGRWLIVLTVLGCALASAAEPASAAPQPLPAGFGPPDATTQPAGSFGLPDGRSVSVGANGMAEIADQRGGKQDFLTWPSPGSSANGPLGPTHSQIAAQVANADRGAAAPDRVIVALRDASLVGSPVGPRQNATRSPRTSDAVVNHALGAIHAVSISPLFGAMPSAQVDTLSHAARTRLGASAIVLSHVEVVQVHGQDPIAAAAKLRATPGVAFAEPDFYVSPMNDAPAPMPKLPTLSDQSEQSHPTGAPSDKPALPSNYGLTSSLQSFLNANGVNAAGAYGRVTSSLGQLPGQGEVITNVSIGDLIDLPMANSGDNYARTVGPTTVVEDGQRYLDLPSMPLIPTYTAGPDGTLDPLGTTEYQDPTLAEVMLDFGVMAPLPHDQQRPDEPGDGATDLLGIAPGAKYRLVVPSQPTGSQIAAAILAAATQSPRPNVINASLGWGSDAVGFAGRYLEDDPVQEAVIAAVVQHYGIVMTVASNDGTRLVSPAAVGPDGGSTPTDVARHGEVPTSVADDYYSTTPSKVADSGAIAVGGITTDDTMAVAPQAGGALSRTGTFAETRISGSTTFSSGFGTRVDVSAPSDAIPSFVHPNVGPHGRAQTVDPVLIGGTSASAPMTAAAAAVVLQAARFTGKHLDPLQVRDLLERTGRAVPTPPQIDRPLHVGPQIDLAAAVNAALSDGTPSIKPPVIARISIAHRQELGNLGGSFVEATDPSAISLTSDRGQDLFGPITFGADVATPVSGARYRLIVGATNFDATTPSVRITPSQLLAAAGQPIVSTEDRSIPVSFEIMRGAKVVARSDVRVVVGPTDGSHFETLAPVVAPVVRAGHNVSVRYDLSGVSDIDHPELVVSTPGHWNPATAPSFHAGYRVALTGTSGTVELPARAFSNGGGIYGVGIVENSTNPLSQVYGQFTPVRLDGANASQRPDAPLLAAGAGSPAAHQIEISRSAPNFTIKYDVRHIPGAAGAIMEISAPGPTLYNTLATFNNPNGTHRDDNGTDTGSTVYRTLPVAAGRSTFDAVQLGLPTSLEYSVRVVPTDHLGRPVGQASPTSFLELDDGLLPGQSMIQDFAIAGPGATVVSALTWIREPGSFVTGSALLNYDPATGAYGSTLASDPTGHTVYETYGSDAARHVTLVGRRGLEDSGLTIDQSVQTYDLTTGAKTSDSQLEGGSGDVRAGAVDPTRHRGALLVWHYPDGAGSVIPFDLSTNTLQSPIPDDPSGAPAWYNKIDIDQASGNAVFAAGSDAQDCVRSRVPGRFASADLDNGTLGATGTTSPCVTGVAAAHDGVSSYVSSSPLIPLPIVAADAKVIPVDDKSAQSGASLDIPSTANVMFPVVDPIHHLAVVASLMGGNACNTFRCNVADNNPMSAVRVIDLTTGQVVKTIPDFNLFGAVTPRIGGDGYSNHHGIQIDPTTRTGWTYGPNGRQLQQFQY